MNMGWSKARRLSIKLRWKDGALVALPILTAQQGELSGVQRERGELGPEPSRIIRSKCGS